MLQKLQMRLRNYILNGTFYKESIMVEWYFLEKENDEGIEYARCFNQYELKLFLEFVLERAINFPKNGKNCWNCVEEENYPFYSKTSNININTKDNLILRKKENTTLSKIVYESPNIILTDTQGKQKYANNLPFNVIGKVYQ